MTPVQCRTCRHFEPWAPNPDQAVGWCTHPALHGYHFAGEVHRCADHSAKQSPRGKEMKQ